MGRRHILVALWWWDERLLAGIAHHATQRGWILDTRVRFANRLPIRRQYDGAIVFAGRSKPLRRLALGIRGPVVNLDQHRAIPKAQRVFCDDKEIGVTAADHLLRCGVDALAFVQMRPRRSRSEQARFEGMRRRCRTGGVRPVAVPVAQLPAFLRESPRPLGLFAANDEVAVESIGACLEANLIVPDDVAILGVDDCQVVCLHAPVALSSVSLNLDQWGLQAAAVLECLMNGDAALPGATVVANSGVVARASTDVAHQLDPRVAGALRFMRANFQRPLKIANLVDQLGVSRQSLQNYFQRQLGHGMQRELAEMRVAHAMQLLRSSAMKMEEISELSGFRDRQHFHRVFHSVTGVAPARWRMEHARRGAADEPASA